MRVLLVSSGSGSRGGGELALVYLARALQERGHEVGAWLPSGELMDGLAELFPAGVEVLRSPYRNTYRRRGRSLATVLAPHDGAKLREVWESFRPDAVHVNKQNLEDGLDLLRAVAPMAVRHLCMVHITQSARWLGARGGCLRDLVARRALRRYPGVFLTTPETRLEELVGFLGEGGRSRTALFVNGTPSVDPDRRRAERERQRKLLGLGPDDLLVVGVGRLVAQKRPGRFLDAVASWVPVQEGLRFAWVGEGDMRPWWEDRVRQPGLEDRVVPCSWVEDVFPWLAAADVFLHTAGFEGLPFALLEAMSHGLPCLLESDLLEQLPPVAGAVLPLDGEGVWMKELATAGGREHWGARALACHRDGFSLEAMGARWEKIAMAEGGALGKVPEA
jgi:glycosyltransferase involved in cell wall biosynthesis